MSEKRALWRDIIGVPIHLFEVILGLFFALGNDRSAACLAIGGAVLTAAYGWPVIGGVIVLYGVLLGLAMIIGPQRG
jgi:lipopolysaccharide export LptBFGC system permease protein LptF